MFGLMPWRKQRPAGAFIPEATVPFALMRRDLDSLFDRFFGRGLMDLPEVLDYPAVWGLKWEETDKEVVVRAEAPGFELADFDVVVTGDVLTIAAMHKLVKDKEEKKAKEERLTELKRYVTLPPGVDATRIEAFYRNGVLEIHLPKTPEACGRRTEVKT
jgi:HSP20 family protein